jgi:hypothetical protein
MLIITAILLIAIAGASVVAGVATIVRLLVGLSGAWAAAWCAIGLASPALTDASITLELPTVGLLFGVTAGACYGLLALLRFGAIPHRVSTGALFGLVGSGLFLVAIVIAQMVQGELMVGDTNGGLVVIGVLYLPVGAVTGAATTILARLLPERWGHRRDDELRT